MANLTDTILAFIDALGVVVARLFVVSLISMLGIAPYALLFFWFGTEKFAFYFGVLAICGFLGGTLYCFVTYFAALQGKDTSWELVDKFPAPLQVALVLSIIPAALMSFGTIVPYLTLPKDNYLRQIRFDLLTAYIGSVCSFTAAIYSMSLNDDLAKIIFSSIGPKNLSDSVLFSLEIISRGFFFDLLEHFRIHISHLAQSDNFWGLFLTYALRFSSSALAISIVVELIKSTKERLSYLDDDGRAR
jgi:hypothetical protein